MRLGSVSMIPCDLSKAFDCVNHEILLYKLCYYGVTGDALMMIKSYLCSRTRNVDINGVRSESANVLIGIPQGSILGPFFFLVHINDLPLLARKHCEIILFAGDTSLSIKIDKKNYDISKINLSLSLINSVNNLMLNAKKTKDIKLTLINNIILPCLV